MGMTDKEKIINGLECCLHDEDDDHGRLCEKCPYDCGDCRKDLYNDVLGLLKEQEAVKPIVEQYALPLTPTSVRFIKKHYCGICKEEITGNNVYCHKCGRKVKWDESVD